MSSNIVLTLRIVTPQGIFASAECDSVRLNAADAENEKGGGSIGIRPGHIPALIALSPCTVIAWRNGETVLRTDVSSGFVSVEKDSVTVISDSALSRPEL